MSVRMLHTCLRIKDLEKSLRFYTEAIGLIETRRKEFPEHKFALVFLSDKIGGYEIELTYNYDTKKAYDIGNGFSHIAIEVEDLEKSRETHRALGYDVTDFKGLPGQKPGYYFVTDPDGYKVEVIRK